MYDYYEFKVTLQGIEPPIWRSFLLPKSATFQDLHKAIQDAGGWWDYHLFAFRSEPYGQTIAGIPTEDPFDGEIDPDAKKVKLSSYFKKGQTGCFYEYDFGDSWIHEVELLKTVTLPYKFKRSLLGGERAFPREDSGGVSGYERFVEFLRTGVDPWDDDPDHLLEWLDGWRPDAFDFTKTKRKFDK